jgi:hypothetical protein
MEKFGGEGSYANTSNYSLKRRFVGIPMHQCSVGKGNILIDQQEMGRNYHTPDDLLFFALISIHRYPHPYYSVAAQCCCFARPKSVQGIVHSLL